MSSLRKGWFKLPGQDGDRDPAEQLLALRPALAGVSGGKRVLDLGCAEGCIAAEFARAGGMVIGIDSVSGHLEVARDVCAGLSVTLIEADLNALPRVGKMLGKSPFDIVLALGILQKLHDPARGVRFCAQWSRDLVLIRSGAQMVNGVIHSKHLKHVTADANAIMKAGGFRLEKVVAGPSERGEDVQYWRRKV